MAKRQSALASVYHRGIYGQPGEPGVRLQEIADLNLVQIAAWPDMLESWPRLCGFDRAGHSAARRSAQMVAVGLWDAAS